MGVLCLVQRKKCQSSCRKILITACQVSREWPISGHQEEVRDLVVPAQRIQLIWVGGQMSDGFLEWLPSFPTSASGRLVVAIY